MNYQNQKVGLSSPQLSPCTNAEPKPMYNERPAASPADAARNLNHMGFGYLFRDKEVPESTVHNALLVSDGVVRYSQQLALAEHRALAIVLFRCAQLVFRARCGEDERAIKFGDQCVIQGSRIHTDADLSGEEVRDIMEHLTRVGVFTRYTANRQGELIFDDWFTFSDENEYFPAYGKLKFD